MFNKIRCGCGAVARVLQETEAEVLVSCDECGAYGTDNPEPVYEPLVCEG